MYVFVRVMKRGDMVSFVQENRTLNTFWDQSAHGKNSKILLISPGL